METYKLAAPAHVEGHAPGLEERYAFDFKAGSHKPKSEAEEAALKQAVEAEQAREANPTPEPEEQPS